MRSRFPSLSTTRNCQSDSPAATRGAGGEFETTTQSLRNFTHKQAVLLSGELISKIAGEFCQSTYHQLNLWRDLTMKEGFCSGRYFMDLDRLSISTISDTVSCRVENLLVIPIPQVIFDVFTSSSRITSGVSTSHCNRNYERLRPEMNPTLSGGEI
jgi:hypothetical protein